MLFAHSSLLVVKESQAELKEVVNGDILSGDVMHVVLPPLPSLQPSLCRRVGDGEVGTPDVLAGGG